MNQFLRQFDPLSANPKGGSLFGMLDGVRVLDFTQALAGPYATMLLGDLGADVIKIEIPGRGDDTRHWGPPFNGGESAYFLSVNRSKRSVSLDLKSREGLSVARELASRSDVVIENFRPGTAARLGIGPDSLRERDPRTIYCSISGFGQDGPPKAGYDQIIQGTSGLMSITGMPDGPPTKVGIPISDMVAGMFAAQAVLAALYDRESSGRGRFIDIALQDSVIALLTFQAGRFFTTGEAPAREGNHHPTISPYGTFQTFDGYINISVGNDGQWERFCLAIEADDLAQDARFLTNPDRLSSREELHGLIEPILQRRSTDEWLKRLEEAGVPAGAIRTLDEVFASEDVLRREMRIELNHSSLGTIFATGVPWKFDGTTPAIRHAPPLLGEHTGEVLREVLGYDKARCDSLISTGAAAAKQETTDKREGPEVI